MGIYNLTQRKRVSFPLDMFLCCAHNTSRQHKHDSSQVLYFYRRKDRIISPLFCTPGKRAFSSKTLTTLHRLIKRNSKSSYKYIVNKNTFLIILTIVLQETENKAFPSSQTISVLHLNRRIYISGKLFPFQKDAYACSALKKS